MENKIKELEEKIDSMLVMLKAQDNMRDNNAIIIDNNFEILNKKIDSLKTKLNSLHTDTQQNFDDVKFELVKIQKTTGYRDIYENNLQVVSGNKKDTK